MKRMVWAVAVRLAAATMMLAASAGSAMADWTDRKSTRLNSSH